MIAGLRKYANNGGSVLVVTHDARVIEIADRILTLEHGRLRA